MNLKDKWFAARDLLGGGNSYLQGSFLMQICNYSLNGDEENHDYAVWEDGKAVGRLLKKCLSTANVPSLLRKAILGCIAGLEQKQIDFYWICQQEAKTYLAKTVVNHIKNI